MIEALALACDTTMLSRQILRRQATQRSLSRACTFTAVHVGGVWHAPEDPTRFVRPPSTSIATMPLTSRRSYTTTALLRQDYPPHTVFPMPALSPTMETGTIASWTLAEGDSFGAGDVLCSIETDKASVDFEAQDEGILAKILFQGAEAADLPVGTPICVVVEEAEDVAAFGDYVVPAASAPAAPTPEAAAPAPVAATTASPTTTAGPSGSSFLMPSARHLAESKGLDATGLAGSGKGGRVTKADVLQALAAGVALPALAVTVPVVAAPQTTPAAAPAAPPPKLALADLMAPPTMSLESPYEDVTNNKMRQIIAKRLTESKSTVPHFYTTIEIALDQVLQLRKLWAKELDMKVSVNDFILKASALALRDIPQVNASFDPKLGSVQPNESVDISVAVATPTGLITPIVFGADEIGLQTMTETIQDLAKRARDGKLAPHEYQGGTFSVSNLGMFGIAEFSAVINPPQAAILAVGSGIPTVRPGPVVETLMTARLSADRRVVDEATAALFGQALREYLEKPESLLL